MSPAAIESALSILPQTVLIVIVCALGHFLYRTLKYLIEKTYEEMIENNIQVRKRLDLINEKLSIVERDSYELKMQMNSFVTVEKHYATTKHINKEVHDVKERVARVEGRNIP